MALTHPLLLAGLVLAGIPILLHLMLRAQPRKLLFPALRLIQNRRRQNVQRLRLRHILLMLLRMLVIALLVFGITRPKVPAGEYAPGWLDGLRLAGLLAALFAADFVITRWWRKQQLPPHVLHHRRTLFRYGLGIVGVLLFLGVVGWPYGRRVAASIADPNIKAGTDVPVAAVLLFDTSLSMQYKLENKTRLDVAKEIAEQHLAGFPNASRAAVAETWGEAPIRLQSLTSARTRLAQVELRPATRPLNDRLEAALQAQIEDRRRLTSGATGETGEQFAREIYVFTDLAASAWRIGESPRLQQLFKELPGVHLYLIDVGVTTPQNVSLTSLSLSDQSPALGSELTVRATLESTGFPAADRTVQLFFENENGKLVDKGKTTLPKVEPGKPVQMTFSLQGMSGTAKQGELRLLSADPLAFDDALYFSVLVQPPPKILVVSDTPASARFVADVLAPEVSIRAGRAKYFCKLISPSQLPNERLKDYAAVWLVNVADPTPPGWRNLSAYVRLGGGLGVIVGNNLSGNEGNYFLPDAKAVLPAVPVRDQPSDAFLDLHDLNHPVNAKFQDFGVVELTSIPIERYYAVDDSVKESRVIARLTTPRLPPILMTRSVGKGYSLILLTAVDSPSTVTKRPWNDLVTTSWSYVVWLDQMTRFLSQASVVNWNHAAGGDVSVPLPESPPVERYLLRKPTREQIPGELAPKTVALTLRDLTDLGNYRVISSEPRLERGFSLNADPAESRLQRITEPQLKEILPEGRFSVARSVDALDRKVRDGRIGKEIYPVVVLFLALAFIGEQFVANWFYRS